MGSSGRGGADGESIFAAHGLTVSFGGLTALDGVSVRVGEGEVLGVIGPNGAGKTTLFNVMCGFVRPDAGTLEWQGRSLSSVRPSALAWLGIARTLQGLGLFGGLTVLENVMAGAQRFRRGGPLSSVLGLPRGLRDERRLRERSMNVLGELGCEELAGELPGTLPYPLQKRVALARALACEPRLLLLDEPAGGLGADELPELQRLIDRLRGSMAVILVEHRMDLVMSACDRVTVLDFGRVIADGQPARIARDEAVLEAYLGRPGDAGNEAREPG
jgi:branched-chain amino acid transport system ATP-binding protein